MDLRVITVDSFTHCRFGGNPAAVVPECEEVPESYFQQIANEINLAQTAFVHQKSEDRYLILRQRVIYSSRVTLPLRHFLCLPTWDILDPTKRAISSM